MFLTIFGLRGHPVFNIVIFIKTIIGDQNHTDAQLNIQLRITDKVK